MTVITHVQFSPPTARDHQHIVGVRWRQPHSGESGDSTTQQMVAFIDLGNDVYATDRERAVAVAVVRPSGRDAYLRSLADGRWTNNLLALPRY